MAVSSSATASPIGQWSARHDLSPDEPPNCRARAPRRVDRHASARAMSAARSSLQVMLTRQSRRPRGQPARIHSAGRAPARARSCCGIGCDRLIHIGIQHGRPSRMERSTASGLFGRSRIARRLSALTSSTPSELASRATNSTCNSPSLPRSPSNRSAQTCAPVSVDQLGIDAHRFPSRCTVPSST